jgi:hypothetical protein
MRNVKKHSMQAILGSEDFFNMSFLKSLLQIKPTAKGSKFVKTETFVRTLQLVAVKMLGQGLSWNDVDAQLRDITVRELLPKRSYSVAEVADFYRNHWQLIDNTWLPAVLKMKQDWLAMTNDPNKFLRERGLLPATPSGMCSASVLDKRIDGAIAVPKEWKEGTDYL